MLKNPKTQCLDEANAPEDVAQILCSAAERYRFDAGELSSAWQDKEAGKVWHDIARILERAADSCERARQRRGI